MEAQMVEFLEKDTVMDGIKHLAEVQEEHPTNTPLIHICVNMMKEVN